MQCRGLWSVVINFFRYVMKEELLLFICGLRKAPLDRIFGNLCESCSQFSFSSISRFLLAIANYFLVRDFLFLSTLLGIAERGIFYRHMRELSAVQIKFLSTIPGMFEIGEKIWVEKLQESLYFGKRGNNFYLQGLKF